MAARVACSSFRGAVCNLLRGRISGIPSRMGGDLPLRQSAATWPQETSLVGVRTDQAILVGECLRSSQDRRFSPWWAQNLKAILSLLSAIVRENEEWKRMVEGRSRPVLRLLFSSFFPVGMSILSARFQGTFAETFPGRSEKLFRA